MAFFADLCYGIPDTADRKLLATKSCIQGSFGFILFSTVFDVKLDTEKHMIAALAATRRHDVFEQKACFKNQVCVRKIF